jgi:hypothetical protein
VLHILRIRLINNFFYITPTQRCSPSSVKGSRAHFVAVVVLVIVDNDDDEFTKFLYNKIIFSQTLGYGRHFVGQFYVHGQWRRCKCPHHRVKYKMVPFRTCLNLLSSQKVLKSYVSRTSKSAFGTVFECGNTSQKYELCSNVVTSEKVLFGSLCCNQNMRKYAKMLAGRDRKNPYKSELYTFLRLRKIRRVSSAYYHYHYLHSLSVLFPPVLN